MNLSNGTAMIKIGHAIPVEGLRLPEMTVDHDLLARLRGASQSDLAAEQVWCIALGHPRWPMRRRNNPARLVAPLTLTALLPDDASWICQQ